MSNKKIVTNFTVWKNELSIVEAAVMQVADPYRCRGWLKCTRCNERRNRDNCINKIMDWMLMEANNDRRN